MGHGERTTGGDIKLEKGQEECAFVVNAQSGVDLGERVRYLLASRNGRYLGQERAAGNNEAELAGCGVPFLVCEK